MRSRCVDDAGSVSLFAVSLMATLSLTLVAVLQGAHVVAESLTLQHEAQELAVQAAQAELRGESGCAVVPAEVLCDAVDSAVHIEVSRQTVVFGQKLRLWAVANEGFGPHEQGLGP